MSDQELTRRIERIERLAQADQREGAPPAVVHALGLRWHHDGEVVTVAADHAGRRAWNRVIGLGLGVPASDDALNALDGFYPDPSRACEIHLSPHAWPADLPDRLAARGFEHAADEIKWQRDASAAAPALTELRIARARGALGIGADDVVREVFAGIEGSRGWLPALVERDGWQVFVAMDDDTVVATGSVFVREQTAWLGIGGTLASHRGRGAQGALLAARIEWARTAGARVMTLETDDDTEERPNPSYRNGARAGFTIAYRRAIWARG